jgi:glycosyltransferase involved in cell wall biosynthesis
LLLSETLLTGGAETFVLRLAHALTKAGINTAIYVLRGDAVDASLHRSIAPTVPVKASVVPLLRVLLKIDGLLYLCGSSLCLVRALQTRALRSFLHQNRPDLVHSHLLSSDLVAARACPAEGVPWIATMHGDYLAVETAGRSRAARIPNFKRALTHIDSVVQQMVTITEPQREQVARLMRIAWTNGRVTKIYNGYSGSDRQQDFVTPSGLAHIPLGAFVVGMVARGVRQKGWSSLIRAFEALNGEDAWLVLVGGGPYIEELRKRSSHPRIVFVGNVTDPLRYVRRFDVACLPTRFPTESLPTVVIEYLVLGKPVIATNVGEISRMIEAACGVPAGLLISLGTEEEMASELAVALQKLYSNPTLRAQLAKLAISAAEKFDMDTCVHAYLSIYKHVAATGAQNLVGRRMTGRPRVLMLTTQLGYGGSESNFVELAKYLAGSYEVTVALFTRDYGSNHYTSAIPELPVPVVTLDDQGPTSHGRFSRWVNRFRRLRELKARHDVTISFLSGPNLLNVICGGASIVSERGSKRHHVGMSSWSKFLWTRIIDPFVYGRSAKVVPVSIGYASEVKAIAGKRHSAKVVPVEGGIHTRALVARGDKPIEEGVAKLAEFDTIVFCGRIDWGKGIDFLLKIFPRVKAAAPRAKLLVIGDGPQLPELHRALEAGGISFTSDENRAVEADVFFAGYRPEPIRYFRVGKVFAFPSQHEGLPNALIEALASGVNVLAADCPYGPRSILAADVTAEAPIVRPYGTLMPEITAKDSERVWSDALLTALKHPLPRRSPEDRHAAIERFDFEFAGTAWSEILEDVLQVNAAPREVRA